MKQTLTMTPEQMNARIFRFRDRRVHMNYTEDRSIPQAAYDAVNPPFSLLLAPVAAGTPESSRPAIAGASGLSVAIFELQPGQKVPLHVHFRSHEAYVCLKGRVKFRWSDHGEHQAILEPFDMIDFPLGLYRDFQCADDEVALILGIVTDPQDDYPGDIVVAPHERAEFVERFGPEVVQRLSASTGLNLNVCDEE